MSFDMHILQVANLKKEFLYFPNPTARLRHALFGGKFGNAKVHTGLHDISFSLQQGETLGVLGRNGAGKTTLLHLLAGSLKPTSGSIERPVRVGTLIALGAGFDPEASGRVNLRLWSCLHADGPFTPDEEAWIADFTELGEALDRPVKNYSQGMQLRLGFAVATARRPDLLIIDEIMAVGDIFFRQKCHDRIRGMVQEGTSVVLVSHDYAEIAQFCRRTLVLKHGQASFLGPSPEAITHYLQSASPSRGPSAKTSSIPKKKTAAPQLPWPIQGDNLALQAHRTAASNRAKITRVCLVDPHGEPLQVFTWGSTMRLLIEFTAYAPLDAPLISWTLVDDHHHVVTGSATHLLETSDWPQSMTEGQSWRVAFDISLQLRFGEYTINLGLADMDADVLQKRRGVAPDELAGYIRKIENLHGAGSIAVIPDVHRTPAVLPHHGIAYVPCQMNHGTEEHL